MEYTEVLKKWDELEYGPRSTLDERLKQWLLATEWPTAEPDLLSNLERSIAETVLIWARERLAYQTLRIDDGNPPGEIEIAVGDEEFPFAISAYTTIEEVVKELIDRVDDTLLREWRNQFQNAAKILDRALGASEKRDV